jgi:hypothetical protein
MFSDERIWNCHPRQQVRPQDCELRSDQATVVTCRG